MIAETVMRAIAHDAAQALANGQSIAPFKAFNPDITLKDSYQIAAGLVDERGLLRVGRKIGFTNRNIWPEFGVNQPMWGPVFASSLTEMTDGTAETSLEMHPEPKIEPEIVFGLGANVGAHMSEDDIFNCIDWIAPGFELVQSIYPNWSFDIEDAIIAGGLHGQLFCGPHVPRDQVTPEMLRTFSISLSRNDTVVDTGTGANVLGSPLLALKHLLDVVDQETPGDTVRAGEVITTGTLTQAFNIEPGERWTAAFSGIGLSRITLALI